MNLVTLTKIGVAVLGGLAMAFAAEAQELPAGSGPVASLTHVQGTVLVNHGKDYVAARPGTPLSAGARVLTMDKSSASVAYQGSCVKQIKENGLLVVQGPADCQTAGAEKAAGPVYAAAIGSELKADASSTDKTASCGGGDGSCCSCCSCENKEGAEREKCLEDARQNPNASCCYNKEGKEREKCLEDTRQSPNASFCYNKEGAERDKCLEDTRQNPNASCCYNKEGEERDKCLEDTRQNPNACCCYRKEGKERDKCLEDTRQSPNASCCYNKEGEEREKCLEAAKQGKDSGTRNCCCCCCPIAFWPPVGVANYAPAAVLLGAGAVFIFNSNRNEQGVSPQ